MQELTPPRSQLLALLREHGLLTGLPPGELDWLADRGRYWRIPAGEVLSGRSAQVLGMYILTRGHLAILVERGGARRRIMEWRAGDVTGTLPFSRMGVPPGDTMAIVDTEGLLVARDEFPALIHDCPALTEVLVHVMVDRARHFVASDLHDEKLISLGKLAAGLAHELNNPAAAAVRAAEQLQEALIAADGAARELGAAGLSGEAMAAVLAVREACLLNAVQAGTPLERSDREDAIAAWLEQHRVDPETATPLAETAVTLPALDRLAGAVPPPALDVVLRWVAAGCATRALAGDIEHAASRMHELVTAVRRFTYMDRATVPEPVDVAAGLRDSITVLGAKAKQKSVAVSLRAAPDLVPVQGFGGELNQVWSNLIDNALDAVAPGGEIIVSAERDPAGVVVRVIDNGPGIPPETLPRIFEPFFTTKPIGQGTGLGLDIVQRLVRKHAAEISVESRPGRTEFRVNIPAA